MEPDPSGPDLNPEAEPDPASSSPDLNPDADPDSASSSPDPDPRIAELTGDIRPPLPLLPSSPVISPLAPTARPFPLEDVSLS